MNFREFCSLLWFPILAALGVLLFVVAVTVTVTQSSDEVVKRVESGGHWFDQRRNLSVIHSPTCNCKLNTLFK